MTTHKPWCVGGDGEGLGHRCDGSPEQFVLDADEVTLHLSGYDDDEYTYVRLNLRNRDFVDMACDLVAKPDEARRLAQRLLFYAAKAETVHELGTSAEVLFG